MCFSSTATAQALPLESHYIARVAGFGVWAAGCLEIVLGRAGAAGLMGPLVKNAHLYLVALPVALLVDLLRFFLTATATAGAPLLALPLHLLPQRLDHGLMAPLGPKS